MGSGVAIVTGKKINVGSDIVTFPQICSGSGCGCGYDPTTTTT